MRPVLLSGQDDDTFWWQLELCLNQGSEWSVEDWTELASQVESQV